MVDLNYCIIKQINVKEYDPQKIVDVIFKAKEYRMKGFTDVEYVDYINGIHRPIDGMTRREREYSMVNQKIITQNLNTVTQQEYIRAMLDNTKKLLQKK